MANALKHFIQFNYKSVFASHKQLVPTRAPASPLPGEIPAYTAWDGSPLAGDDFANALATAQLPFLPDDTHIDTAVFWTTLGTDISPTAVAAMDIALSGSTDYTGWAEAVQRTWSFKTSAFNFLKIIMLDTPTSNNFGRYTGSLDTPGDAFTAYITGDTHAIAGRDINRPVAFWSLTIDLNDKLRREYHLT